MRIQTSLTILGLVSLTVASGCGRFGTKKSTTPTPFAANEKKSDEVVGIEYASPEKTLVDQAFQRAKANKKLLVIDVSAAWCAPCKLASKGMQIGSEKFNEVMKKYEFLELEQTFFSAEDYLPFEISSFPSFVVVDPAMNKWAVTAGYENVDKLAEKLETFATKKSFLDEQLNKFRENLAQNKKLEISLYEWSTSIIAEKSTEEISSLFAEIKKANADKPELFDQDEKSAWQWPNFKGKMYRELIARGVMTLQDVISQDPNYFTSIANNSGSIGSLAFAASLKNIRREKGSVAAAKACDALADKVTADYVFTPKAIPEGANAEETKKITEDNEKTKKSFERSQINRKYTCLLENVLTKLAKNDAVLAFVNSFSEEDLASGKSLVSYVSLSKLLAFSGADFARAITYVEKSTADSLKSKEEYIAKTEKEIVDLKAAGKTEEAARSEFWLEGSKLTIPALHESAEKRIAAYKAGLAHPEFLKK